MYVKTLAPQSALLCLEALSKENNTARSHPSDWQKASYWKYEIFTTLYVSQYAVTEINLKPKDTVMRYSKSPDVSSYTSIAL